MSFGIKTFTKSFTVSKTVSELTIENDLDLQLHEFQAIPENTANTTDISGLTGNDKWSGGVLIPNRKIYGIPYDSESVLIVDPIKNTIDTTSITGLTGSSKWVGGVLAPNRKIYGIPYDSENVLIIDPKKNNMDTTSITGLTGNEKWRGGVLAPNGKIYGIPFNSESVLIIDPETNKANTTDISGLIGTKKWAGGVLGINGNIYGMPFDSESVLIIDTSKNTANTTSITGLIGDEKWFGGVLAPNGKIYAIPYNSENVLTITTKTNPTNVTTFFINGIGGISGEDIRTLGTLSEPNDYFKSTLIEIKMIGISSVLSQGYQVGGLRVYDSSNNLIITNEIGTNKNPDGTFDITVSSKVNLLSSQYPLRVELYNSANFIINDLLALVNVTYVTNANRFNFILTNTADITDISGLTGIKKWVGGALGPNGKIYGIPFDRENVLIIDTSENTVNTTDISGLIGDEKWQGGVLSSNGKIYGIPYRNENLIKINTDLPNLQSWMLGPHFNKL